LLSYGAEPVDAWRGAASHIDRILRCEKPGDLPVQLPTKFEMVVNRKTAKALGLEVPFRFGCGLRGDRVRSVAGPFQRGHSLADRGLRLDRARGVLPADDKLGNTGGI
jgi:hypothetical protein